MTTATSVSIGPFVAEEVPEPLAYTFLDSAGTPLDLTGFTAEFHLSLAGGTATVLAAAVTDEEGGEVTYTWVEDDLETPGLLRAFFWVDNGTNRFASLPLIGKVRRNV